MSAVDILTLIPAQAAGGENALMGMLPIILMFVVLYFLMIRPQMKRQKEHRNLVSNLAKGDEVITSGGLLGKVAFGEAHALAANQVYGWDDFHHKAKKFCNI